MKLFYMVINKRNPKEEKKSLKFIKYIYLKLLIDMNVAIHVIQCIRGVKRTEYQKNKIITDVSTCLM